MERVDGWLCLDKQAGLSSNFAMVLVRKILQQKTGYVGTLDPFATGVLPIAVGRARHFIKYLDAATKRYIFTIQFGESTDSLDITGNVVNYTAMIPSRKILDDVLKSFKGKILQIPPRFSAIKVKGRRACDLVRAGKEVDLCAREMEIFSLEIVKDELLENQCITLEVHCSKGMYVRSLARDIAKKAGSLGYVKELRRTECGFFSLNYAITIEKFREIKDTTGLKSVLIPIDMPLGDIPAISLELSEVSALLQGRSVTTGRPRCPQVRVLGVDQRFYGVCDICGGLIKPLSMFVN